jgi:ParB family chromosome partitioning protein
MIDLDLIGPNRRQPRQRFDAESLDELANSLKEKGLIQPVVVRPAGDGKFELVVGERRWRAAQRAGLLKIPAIVREIPEERLLEVALVENIQREELNPIDEAQAYRTLINDIGLTQQEVAQRVGKQRPTIANMLRLLALPTPVQEMVRTGALSMGHARAITTLESPARQEEVAARVTREDLSVRQTERLVAWFAARTPPAKQRPAPRRDPNVVAAEEALQRALGSRVRIVQGRKGGRIELYFYSPEELDRIYDLVLEASRKPRS